MTDPTIVTVEADHPDMNLDPHQLEQVRSTAAERVEAGIPPRYAEATVTDDRVAGWVRSLVETAVADQAKRRKLVAQVGRGPSLLLAGFVGTGKTHNAYGALRALAVSGVQCGWVFSTAADIYAALRPRAGVDSEAEFERFAKARLLVIDDLGAAKGSEWNEEINYRLVNHRYEYMLPTLVTTNVTPNELAERMGERVASRLVDMAPIAAMRTTTDRRRNKGGEHLATVRS